jgi:hypothetical protein
MLARADRLMYEQKRAKRQAGDAQAARAADDTGPPPEISGAG